MVVWGNNTQGEQEPWGNKRKKPKKKEQNRFIEGKK